MNAKWFLEEVLKSRAAMSLAGFVAMLIGKKLGMSPEEIMAIGALSGLYVGGKSYTDARESKADASKPAAP